MNPIMLMRKTAPSLVIGLMTASSSAAYGELNSCCTEKLGVNEKAVRFAVPFGLLLCQTGCAFALLVNSMYAIKIYNVDISLMTLIISVIITTMLAIAAPPVPGGLMACYAILFAHFSIPNEALAIAMTLDVFMDFAGTASNITVVPAIAAIHADKLGMVDRNALLDNKKK